MPVVMFSFKRDIRARSAQRGVSLLIAMCMLVIIGLVSVSVMRNAKSSDAVSANTRAQTQANQYAQAAERFCESQIGTKALLGYVPGTTGPYWTTFANWYSSSGSTKAYTLTTQDLSNSAKDIATPPKGAMPQCMFEDVPGPGFGVNAYIVTARGFSLDYVAESSGNTKTGSVVWLQAYVNVQSSVPAP